MLNESNERLLIPAESPEQPEPSDLAELPTLPATRLLGPRWRTLLRDGVVVAALIAITYLLVNLTTTRAAINGYSMQPELLDGDVVLVNRIAYLVGDPQRGDVVVIRPPSTLCANASVRTPNCQPLIKRVIGLPGEVVKIRRGVVLIDGLPLEEPYIIPENFCDYSCDSQFILGVGEYLVLGDNRLRSYDGHYFGPIKRDSIVGQAWLRYWPLERFQFITHPRYDELMAAAKERP